jgi:hypothetical protein
LMSKNSISDPQSIFLAVEKLGRRQLKRRVLYENYGTKIINIGTSLSKLGVGLGVGV